MPRDKETEKLSATKKSASVSAAKYRTNVLNRANDEQKAAGTPKVAVYDTSGSIRPSPSKQSQPKIQKTGAGNVSASGNSRKHGTHNPRRGDDSTLKAGREVSKPDATQASKGGFKQPSTAVGSAGEKRRHGKEEEAQPDAPVQRLTVVQMAKEMLRTLDPEDKASVRGVDTLNLDAILGNLCEVKKDLDSACSKINELKAEVKGLKEKLEPLQEAKKKAERAKERVGRLANQQQQLKAKFQSQAEEEKHALVKQMMKDYDTIMRMAWEALQPGADFGIWKSKFDQANEDFNAELLRQAEEEANKDDADGDEADSSSGSSGDEDGEEEDDQNEEQPATDDAAANVNNPSAP
ncbi:uncharacterized protein LOC110703997 [Chenopodium quinoa]|uniref:uncharacterized protein LOC110703997 n=1 Tax=Chenopodium quinoa TaxID=63459 RepID=UPI000B798693|nr:uncharacterized protein LOC110703997 [Chenopodium quinoa]